MKPDCIARCTIALFLSLHLVKGEKLELSSGGEGVCGELISSMGAQYNSSALCTTHMQVDLAQPQGSKIVFNLASQSVDCGTEGYTHACIYVPGLNPTSIGNKLTAKSTDVNIPSAGFTLFVSGGSQCEAMPHKNRTANIYIQCPDAYESYMEEDMPYLSVKGKEGVSPHLCEYYITIVSNTGCPQHVPQKIAVTAVTGCKDSVPVAYTQSCSSLGGSQLTLHGLGFLNLRSRVTEISLGQSASCTHVNVVNDWLLRCVVRVPSQLVDMKGHSFKIALEIVGGSEVIVLVHDHVLVSFTSAPDLKGLFSDLRRYGIGGMQRQATEIYNRVFLSRTLPAHIVAELGLTHVKGVILHGAPGTGKTLLARTIGSILDPQHVHMVSAPELLNKYVGESERNLRVLFAKAENDWLQLRHNSPFHVIILDEIDAICKPRAGDADNYGSLVFDNLVNQLLTKLDGLRQIENLLVIGLTNRFELLDSALLRPGRFEVLIEMELPDLDERQEVIEVHLATATASGRLSPDVSILRLAQVSAGCTHAQLAGMVRQAQAIALSRAQREGRLESASIGSDDLEAALAHVSPHSLSNLTLTSCSPYTSVYDVLNSSLPKTALVQVESERQISHCLKFLLQQRGFQVKVVEPRDVLKDPHALSQLHQFTASRRSSKVAVILVDLCFMVESCYGPLNVSHSKAHSFLLSMRAFIQTDNDVGNRLLFGICSSTCDMSYLKPHFMYIFVMVSKGPLTSHTPHRNSTNL